MGLFGKGCLGSHLCILVHVFGLRHRQNNPFPSPWVVFIITRPDFLPIKRYHEESGNREKDSLSSLESIDYILIMEVTDKGLLRYRSLWSRSVA